jgi:hypothetical protein
LRPEAEHDPEIVNCTTPEIEPGSMVGKIIVLAFVLCFFGAIRQPSSRR